MAPKKGLLKLNVKRKSPFQNITSLLEKQASPEPTIIPNTVENIVEPEDNVEPEDLIDNVEKEIEIDTIETIAANAYIPNNNQEYQETIFDEQKNNLFENIIDMLELEKGVITDLNAIQDIAKKIIDEHPDIVDSELIIKIKNNFTNYYPQKKKNKTTNQSSHFTSQVWSLERLLKEVKDYNPEAANQINNFSLFELLENTKKEIPLHILAHHKEFTNSSQKWDPKIAMWIYQKFGLHEDPTTEGYFKTSIHGQWNTPQFPQMRKCYSLEPTVVELFHGVLEILIDDPQIWYEQHVGYWAKQVTNDMVNEPNHLQTILKPQEFWLKFAQKIEVEEQQPGNQLISGLQLLVLGLYNPEFSISEELQKKHKSAVLIPFATNDIRRIISENYQNIIKQSINMNNSALTFPLDYYGKHDVAKTTAGILLTKFYIAPKNCKELLKLNKWGSKGGKWVMYRQYSRTEYNQWKSSGRQGNNYLVVCETEGVRTGYNPNNAPKNDNIQIFTPKQKFLQLPPSFTPVDKVESTLKKSLPHSDSKLEDKKQNTNKDLSKLIQEARELQKEYPEFTLNQVLQMLKQ